MSPPQVCQRHATFIAKRLAITSGVLAVAPFFLAFRGAPTGAETLVFACSFAPLAAAVLVARTGWLAAAHGLAFLGLIAMSLSLWLGLGCGSGCAIAWLVTAQLEATLAGDKRLARAAGVVTGMALVGILAVTLKGDAALSPAAAIPGAFAGLSLAYATVIAAGSWNLVEPSRRQNNDEADAWRIVSDMLEDVVVRFDTTGTVVQVPTDCEAKLGVPSSDLMGRGLFEHVHVADRPAFLKQIADAAYGVATTATKIRLRTSRGVNGAPTAPRYVWIEIRARHLATAGTKAAPEAAEVVAMLRDIDDAHRNEVEIIASQKSTEEAIHAKDHFLANMTHELRTPLNAIIGFSEMLASRTLRPVDADKQREYARIVHQSGQHLLSVVNAILDMSKMRSGTFSIVPEAFDIVPIIDLCCDMVALKAEEGRVQIVRDYPAQLEELVGDKRACKQILINLLSNAVKFTPEHGQVTVSARPEGNALVMSVSDTGIGIGTADLAQLGDPFFQARSSFSRPFEGTGLGLSVVRGLVGLHGGTIALESELGRGTRVNIRLPLDCRVISQKSASATIETIARRHVPDPALSRTDRRMKQIA